MKIIITGAAGFIGFHLSKLLSDDHDILGIDSFNDYYDTNLKRIRAKILDDKDFHVEELNLSNLSSLKKVLKDFRPDIIINLAAQAGVRYSLIHPEKYIDSNIIGFFNLVEASKELNIKTIIYASSSSVYGGNEHVPFKEQHNVNKPLNIYAASKIFNELLANVMSGLYGTKFIGLRFFSVYGPFGRPDMAYYFFTKKILEKQPIEVFGKGKLSRDFTYIDDITNGINGILENLDRIKDNCIYNLGNDYPVSVNEMISLIEKHLNKKANIIYRDNAPGEVEHTHADISLARKDFGYNPKVKMDDGLKSFTDWYIEYKKLLD